MSQYFSDHVIDAIEGRRKADHAVSIVFAVAQLHAALMHAGAPLETMDVAKVAVRLTMSVDLSFFDGSERIEVARYKLLEYWLDRFRREGRVYGSVGGLHVRTDTE